ncbi:hypothetical protein GCM10009847_06790 [Leucobacter tardus]
MFVVRRKTTYQIVFSVPIEGYSFETHFPKEDDVLQIFFLLGCNVLKAIGVKGRRCSVREVCERFEFIAEVSLSTDDSREDFIRKMIYVWGNLLEGVTVRMWERNGLA